MAIAPLLIPTLSTGSSSSSRAYAATAAAAQDGDNDEDNDDDGDNDEDEDNDDDADNDNDNDNDNDDSDNDDDDNDNQTDGGMVNAAPASAAPAPAPAATCSTPGQEMTFVSADGRVTVRVFGTMTQAVTFSIRQPIDPSVCTASARPGGGWAALPVDRGDVRRRPDCRAARRGQSRRDLFRR